MTQLTAYIALGANLGDRRANLERAVDLLRATPGVRVTKVSSFIETPAVGGPPGSPPFLNAAAELETTHSPRELLDRLLAIEQTLGRQRREKWGPRVIDLDLLLYGDETIAEPNLQVPHPLMHERRFVLTPLAEIAAAVIHPRFHRSVATLLESLPQDESVPTMAAVNDPQPLQPVVVDTSAIIAVLLNERTKPEVVRATVDREALVPSSVEWEVANALSAMLKRRRLTRETALAAMASFCQIPLRIVPFSMEKVLALSADLEIYASDAGMIACAQESGATLLTLDGGLRHAAGRVGVRVEQVTP